MKHFLSYVALFLLPLLLVAAGMEAYLRQVPNSYRYKAAWMAAYADSVETLVLGNSHVYYGIRPSLLQGRAFSLANLSQRPDYARWLLAHYAPRCPRLRRVVLSLSCFTLDDPRFEDGEEWFVARYYRIYMGCDLHARLSKYNLEVSDYKSAKLKFEQSLRGGAVHPCDSLGWGTDYRLPLRTADLDDDRANAEAATRHKGRSRAYVDYNLAQLRAIAALCRQRRLQLVLVTTPGWRGYVRHLDAGQLAEMREAARQMVRDYGAVYLDYLQDARFGKDDFFDSDHLSDVGADRFTRILQHDLSARTD